MDLTELSTGAEGETRTRTSNCPPPPQDGVSTSSTTSANGLSLYSIVSLTVNPKYYFCTGVGAGAGVTGASTELGIIVCELGAV